MWNICYSLYEVRITMTNKIHKVITIKKNHSLITMVNTQENYKTNYKQINSRCI